MNLPYAIPPVNGAVTARTLLKARTPTESASSMPISGCEPNAAYSSSRRIFLRLRFRASACFARRLSPGFR